MSSTLPSSCALCAMTCPIELKPDAPDQEIACSRGREGRQRLQATERLTEPTIQGPEGREAVDWERALGAAAEVLQGCLDRHGPNSVAVLCSATLQLEAAWMIRQLALDGLNTTQIGCLGCVVREGWRTDLDPLLGRTASTACLEDIDRADLVLVVGADPARSHPQLAARLDRASARGVHVAVLHSSHTDLAETASTWVDPRRGTLNLYLAALLDSLRGQCDSVRGLPGTLESSMQQALEGFDRAEALSVCGTRAPSLEALARRLRHARRVVAIYDLDDQTERSESDLALLACVLACLDRLVQPGSGLLLLHAEANAAGISLADLYQDLAPSILDGRIRGLLVIGEDPLERPRLAPTLQALEALVVLDAHASPSVERSNVALPTPSLAESEGTLVRCDGRVCPLERSAPPAAGLGLLELIHRLAEQLGVVGLPQDPEAARSEISVDLGRDADYLERLRSQGGRLDWNPSLAEQPVTLTPIPGCWPALFPARPRLQELLWAHRRSEHRETP
jgi:formate dehydrogenase major subunit